MRETLAFGIFILARKNVYLSLHSLYHMSRERTKYKCLKNTFSWKIWRLSEKYLLGSCRKVDNLHQFSLNLKSIFTEAIPSKTHYFQSFKVFARHIYLFFHQRDLWRIFTIHIYGEKMMTNNILKASVKTNIICQFKVTKWFWKESCFWGENKYMCLAKKL